ncbi:MAG: prepilin-type N-terminal cleavage/methylation domain-containing protein [Gemmatimonadota bacterium]|nr:prepilin-type N-terminal cleavage/methylation domain-containing protein [Gemmatimonadota bacterium]MDH5284651.1 prepilin-type N-terminal cleavage/methylation domain-containing protein [Gemmatimonadota bacterium]
MTRTVRGTTLVELLVVLALLGVLLGTSSLSVVALRPAPSDLDRARADSARRAAILSGQAVTIRFDSTVVRYLPDGGAIGVGVDRLTGTRRPP